MQKLKFLRTASGSALITSLVMGVVFSIIAITILRLTTRGSQLGKRDVEAIKSYWANEGFLRLTLRALSLDQGDGTGFPSDPDASTPMEVCIPEGLSLNGYSTGGANPNVEATVQFVQDNNCKGVYNITVKTTLPDGALYNVTSIDTVVVKSIQRYTFFEDSTTPDPLLWREFIVYGDFHSNGYIKIANDMGAFAHVVGGEATTSGAVSPAETYPDPYDKGMTVLPDDAAVNESWLKARFPEYAHIGEVQTDFIDANSFTDEAYYIKDGANKVTEPVAIHLKSDGSIDIYKKSDWSTLTTPSSDIIKAESEVTVWGTLLGKKTIVSADGHDIILGGDIAYENGLTGESATDALALVSGRNIVVPDSFGTAATTPAQAHAFKTSGGTIHGCLFMKNGGLLVADINSYTPQAATGALPRLEIVGCALVCKDLDKIWEYEDNTFGGLNCVYRRDKRYYNNMVAPPGVPFPKATDEERSAPGTDEFMWVLASGRWHNRLVSANE
ncbi:MAG: hypothetical protein GF418_02660 [Chitinivibrionales bacterium]|nr:hypothetical protein [Chitinivibrionales bacterium]MBD3394503.1 hypothetical protein [Chitinivibrionales bacterium]